MSEKIFYIVATPIGNLADITFRAVQILKEVDMILCEDTRVTSKLLSHYGIKKPLVSYHQQSRLSKIDRIIKLLHEDKNLALVTDAGTPGISDPGNELIKKVLDEFGGGIKIVPIPGASALTSIVQVAGIDMTKFLFMGFPPHKKGRETFFVNMLQQDVPVVYYDSPYRFVKNLKLIKQLNGAVNKQVRLIVGRELTKMFEEISRGDLDDILKIFLDKKSVKGELVVVLY